MAEYLETDEEIYNWARRKYLGTRNWLERFGDGQPSKSGFKWPQSEIEAKQQDLKMFARVGNDAKDRIKDGQADTANG